MEKHHNTLLMTSIKRSCEEQAAVFRNSGTAYRPCDLKQCSGASSLKSDERSLSKCCSEANTHAKTETNFWSRNRPEAMPASRVSGCGMWSPQRRALVLEIKRWRRDGCAPQCIGPLRGRTGDHRQHGYLYSLIYKESIDVPVSSPSTACIVRFNRVV